MNVFIWKFCLFDKNVVQNLLEVVVRVFQPENYSTINSLTKNGDIDKQREVSCGTQGHIAN